MPHLIVLVQLKQKVCNVSRWPTTTATAPQQHEIWAQFRSYSDYILLHSAFFNIQFLFSAEQDVLFNQTVNKHCCLYLKYYLTISNLRHVLWSSIWTKCCQWRFMISHKNESSKHCDIFFPPCPHITGYSLWTGTFFDLTDDDWISMTILLKFLALEHISMFLCRYR